MRLHHVGIAVASLEEAIPIFTRLLGCQPAATERVEDQGVRVAVFELGNSRVELLEAVVPDSPVARYITRHGPGIHHLTLAVPDIRSFLNDAERSGIRLIDEEPRAGASGGRIAFLHPKSTAGVLIEVVEEAAPKTRER